MSTLALLLADSDKGKASGIGLVIILALVVATYFLYRSMSKHVRRVPPTFDDRGPDGRPIERSDSDEEHPAGR